MHWTWIKHVLVQRRDYVKLLGQIQKWHPIPLKGDGFWIPNLIETYPCGATYKKEICYRILHSREMGVKVLKVTMTWMSGAWRPIKTAKIMVCGTNLQILTEDHGVLWNLQSRPCLRNTNKFLNGSKMGKSWSTADWLALVSVDFLVFHTWSQKTLKCAVFWMQIMDYEASQDFWKQRGSVQYCFEYRSCWMEV